MKSFKSRQDWEASQIDVTPMGIRHRITAWGLYRVKKVPGQYQSVVIHNGGEPL